MLALVEHMEITKLHGQKIGKAFENSAGNITLMLDALPVSGEGGQAKITLFIDDGKKQ